MHTPRLRRPRRLPALILGCLAATLVTAPLPAETVLIYMNGQNNTSNFDTSGVNDPTRLRITSGTATHSGILSGSGLVVKEGAGTLILSGLNNYTNDTVVRDGTLQVFTGATVSTSPANIYVADLTGDIATLLITGGTVTSANGYVGNEAGTLGTVTMSGGSWTNSHELNIGIYGSGVLNLSGGSLNTSTSIIGLNLGSTGTANVSGGTWSTSVNLYVGTIGTGVLNLSGGSIDAMNAAIGFNKASSGTANVSGGSWTTTDIFYIAYGGTGVLNLSGGSIGAVNTTMGANTNSNGTANVSGGSWTNDVLNVGYYGTGVLNLSGGSVSSSETRLGYDSGSSGTANVSGGTWTNSGDLYIGRIGTGVLNLSGGSVSNSVGYLGSEAGSSGTANVSGGTWSNSAELFVGKDGTGVLNLSGGSVSSLGGYLGHFSGSSGTANVSGGTWTNAFDLSVGYYATGVLNLSGGSVGTANSSVGVIAGATGTVNMSGGTWTNSGYLIVGTSGSGTVNLSGGSLSSTNGYVGYNSDGIGTANVSGGSWTNSGELRIGASGTGTLNLAGPGTVTVGPAGGGVLKLAVRSTSSGTLNVGTGGVAGTLNAGSVSGGLGTAVVNFNHADNITFAPTLTGTLSVNQVGSGTTTLTTAHTYTGTTSVLGGTLELSFSPAVTSNILPTGGTLSLGSGTLLLSGTGTQTLGGFSTAGGAGRIVLGAAETLTLGTLGTVAPGSAVNFNTAAGGANGATVGSGVIVLSGPSAGSVIDPRFTVTDSMGFGLATVNEGNQIIRLTTTDLLPASDVVAGTDYRIDNNNGGSTAAGSATLIVTGLQSAGSITVDTTAAAGVLTLAPAAVITTNVWNFGGNGSNTYEITGGAGSGITANGVLQINNYNSAPVTISTSIQPSTNTGLLVSGPGTTILTAVNTYTGSTTVTSGVLEVAATGSITIGSSVTIGNATGDDASLVISGGSFTTSTNAGFGVVGSSAGSRGTVTVNGGSLNLSESLSIGENGTGVLNLTSGTVSSTYTAYVSFNPGSQGTVNVSGGTWTMTISDQIFIGKYGTGVVNLSGGTINHGTVYMGSQTGGSATVNVSGGSWTSIGVFIGDQGTGVVNLSAGSISLRSVSLGNYEGGSGTANVSGGTWVTTTNAFTVGAEGTGVFNLTGSGVVTAGTDGIGTVSLATTAGSSGTLNLGIGGTAGTLNAAGITGGAGTAVVNFNHTGSYAFAPALNGSLSVNKLSSGTTTLTTANTYTGRTSVFGGTLELGFGTVTTNILSSSSVLTLGGGTLRLTGAGTQTLNGLTTIAGTGSSIVVSGDSTLNLGALISPAGGSALNFNTAAGGADGATVGTGIITLTGLSAGATINTGFTVTDATGFGLATVNASNQIIRLTTGSDLLPASGAVGGTDYRIDNNPGGSTTAGSAALVVSASETARSITVDTTAAAGTLTLGVGAVLGSDVWNFGGTGTNPYVITTASGSSGIKAATAGAALQINNYNDGNVSINVPILDNGGSGLRVAGTSTTLLNGTANYTGATVISSGTTFINGDFTAATGSVTVQSTATLGGTGTLGGHLRVESGGVLTPGNFVGQGTLSGITATFDSNSVFHVQGANTLMTRLDLTGAVTIAPGALLYLDTTALTGTSYTLMTAASGLDSEHAFTLSIPLPTNYELVYDGTTLKLNSTTPVTAFWTGKVDSNWSSLSAGTSNWSTAVDGTTDTASVPGSTTDVTFSATGVGQQQTNLDVDFTVKSLTVNTDTTVSTTGTHTLTVDNATSVNALLAINSGVTLIGKDDLTVSTSGNLAGSGSVEMATDQNIFASGTISVGDPTVSSAQILSLTTSGSGAVVMGPSSLLIVNLYSGAGAGDNTALPATADQLNLHGTLDATAGGTLVISNPNTLTSFAGGDQWKVIELNGGAGSITGALALNDSALALATGFVGTFDQATGIYSIADYRPQLTAQSSGLPMANAESQAIISGAQTALNDVNNHLFNLRSGGGEEEEESDGSISAALDYGVVEGEGDGPESPMARRMKRSRQWEVFTTVNYGNARLNPISNQSGVQIDSWASSVGIERHLSRGLTLGFAATFLQSTQTYTGGLGTLDLEGPMLSAYVTYVKRGFWSSFLYSFGYFDLGSQRNPGLGLPVASGSTNSYVNAVQYNTGYNFRFQNNTFVTGPFIGIDYLHGSVEEYNETGGGLGALHYNEQSFESLVTRIGWSASKKIETDWATVTPQVRLSYERQNLKNNGTSVNLINAPFSAAGGNQSPGQDYMVFGTGINFQFTPDFSMLLGYQVQLFRNNMETHFGSVRFGYKF